MSFFDSFKEESKQRKKDKREAQIAIEKETERIRQEREKARENRNIIRKKIKIVDNIASNREEQEDQRKLEEVKAKQAEKLKELRTERSISSGHTNRNKAFLIIGICVLVIAGSVGAGCFIHHNKAEQSYEAAVKYVLDEDYQKAIDILKDININDSQKILDYARCQNDLESYKGKASVLEKELNQIGMLDNDEAQKQKEYAEANAALAKEIQQGISGIHYNGSVEDIKKDLKAVEGKLSKLDERYQVLVDFSSYTKYVSVVENLENGTPIGKTIIAIDGIGKVTLKSKEKIDSARAMYDKLSESEKELVINYKTLQSAEGVYVSLKREEEENAKEEAEENERLNFTVYVSTHGGKVYHSGPDCPQIEGSGYLTTMTQKEAIEKDYASCGTCVSSFFLP